MLNAIQRAFACWPSPVRRNCCEDPFAFPPPGRIIPLRLRRGASAETVADFYSSKKNLTLIIASGIGGGYDPTRVHLHAIMAVMFPAIRISSRRTWKGASGLEATNFVANKAPRDGATILATYNSLLLLPLFDRNRVRYDVRTMNWIGSIATATEDCFTWFKTPIKTIAQAMDQEVLMGATGATGDFSNFSETAEQPGRHQVQDDLGLFHKCPIPGDRTRRG